MRIIEWVKHNRLAAALLILIFYFFGRNLFGISLLSMRTSPSTFESSRSVGISDSASFGAAGPTGVSLSPSISLPSFDNKAAAPAGTERLVVNNSNLSLLVKDVRQVGDRVVAWSQDVGGFMVSVSYNRPTESPFATITVRVPAERFEEALVFFRSLGIKVTNENLVGTDVTEEFIDIESRLRTLDRTKQKFEQILDIASEVDEILKVQREILNTQTQIDNLVGRRDAIQKNADFSKITIFLSTDELALPYTPDKTFRPNVIFKLAVRSLLNSLRIIGSAIIWLGVYAIIWIPALIIFVVYRKWRASKKRTAQRPPSPQ